MGLKKKLLLYSSLVLLCAAFLVTAFSLTAGNIAQAEETEPLFYVENTFGAKGRQIEVSVRYTDISRMAGAQFVLTYDPEKLEPVDVKPGGAINESEDYFEFNLAFTSNSINVVSARDCNADSYLPQTGEFCRVIFNALQGGSSSAPVIADLVLSQGDLVVASIESGGAGVVEAGCPAQGGQAEMYEVLYGDVDVNSKVTVLDARMASRASLGLEPGITDYQKLAADVDGNGKITVIDARLISRHTLGIEPVFPVENID